MEKTEEKQIRVLLMDPKSHLMQDIARSLQKNNCIAPLPVSEDVTPFSELITTHQPDIILCDIDYRGRCDFSILNEVERVSEGKPKVIGFTDCDDIAVAATFIYQGGWGFELKNCGVDEIALAVLRVSQGHCFVCTSLVNNFFFETVHELSPPTPEHLKALTETEGMALAIYKRDGDVKEVALELKITVSTAETHLRNIRRKLGIHSKDQMLRKLAFTVLE